MVEKAKGFKIEDKVFGKVKGYPAWPARITSINGKRYGVVFYGTNETGTLKQDDIFYYLSHKHKVPKQKRRFYAEAVIDIELDIEKCGGSDGNDNPQDENSQEPAPPKGGKRKRTSMAASKKVQDSAAPPSNKRIKLEDHNLNDITSENNVMTESKDQVIDNATQSTLDTFTVVNKTPSPTPEMEEAILLKDDVIEKVPEEEVKENDLAMTNVEEIIDEPSKEEDMILEEQIEQKEQNIYTLNKVVNEIPDNITNTPAKEDIPVQEQEGHGQETVDEAVADKADEVERKQQEEPKDNPYYTAHLTVKDVILLPDFYLTAITLYAECVQDNSHYYKISKPDPVSLDAADDNRMKVLPVKIDADKYCGLIYAPKPLENYRCEYDRALEDAKLVEELLELKAEIDVGNPDLNDHRFIKHLDCDDAYVQHSTISSIVAYKKSKLQWLQAEMEAFKPVLEIKKCLSMQAARTEEAISLMESMLNAKLEVISLKKRAFIVDTITRLCRYVGNVKDWDIGEEEMKTFEENAGRIRDIAEKLMGKIRALFDYGNEPALFLQRFEAECEVFNDATRGMSEAVVFSLCAEPLSRKAQLELIFDEQANNQNNMDVVEAIGGNDETSDACYTPD